MAHQTNPIRKKGAGSLLSHKDGVGSNEA